MPIQLEQQLKHVSKVVRLDSSLPGNNKDWMVWWYCGVFKNRKADSQPNALVAFRQLLNSGSLSDEVNYRRVPLTTLGQIRVGTVWRDGQCQAETVLDNEKFTVDFTKENWKLTSFRQAAEEGSLQPTSGSHPWASAALVSQDEKSSPGKRGTGTAQPALTRSLPGCRGLVEPRHCSR